MLSRAETRYCLQDDIKKPVLFLRNKAMNSAWKSQPFLEYIDLFLVSFIIPSA